MRRDLIGILVVGLALALLVEFTSRLGAPASPGNVAADAWARGEASAGVAAWVLRGSRAAEGALTTGERRLVLAPQTGVLELEFREATRIRGLLIQADADDRYRIEATADGAEWRRIGAVRPMPGEGFRTRAVTLGELPPLRGLRLRAVAPGLSTLSAVRAYRELPADWPRVAQESGWGAWPIVTTLGPILEGRAAIALLGLAGALLWWWGRRRSGSLRAARGMLAAAGLLALLSGWDFFQHSRPLGYYWAVQNPWDVYHYYLGAKYGPELGYTELYHCTLVADLEAGLAPLREQGRLVRELTTNELVPVSGLVSDSDRCLSRFTPERWRAFSDDVGWFRSQLAPNRWLALSRDHGYNPSPAWAVIGRPLAQAIPLSDAGFAVLMAFDVLLAVALWAVAWRTFGLPAAAVGLVFVGANFAAGHWWTHGAFLRQGWLFLSVLGLCSLRTGRPATAGFLLAWATLLRIFPALFVIGVALRAGVDAWKSRSLVLSAERRRFVAGGLVAVLVIGGLSLIASGRVGAWPEFVRNTQKHYGVSALNTMGALAVTASLEDALGLRAAERPREAPQGVPSEAVDEPLKTSGPGSFARGLRAALALLVAPLLLMALRREPDWAAAILATAWIPFITELGSYYYVLIGTWALLAARREVVAVGVTALALVMGVIGIWDGGLHYRETFVASSACIVLFAFWLLAVFALARERRGDASA